MIRSGFWTSTSKRFYHSTRDIVPRIFYITNNVGMASVNPTVHISNYTGFIVGHNAAIPSTGRVMLKADFSDVSPSTLFSSVTLYIVPITDFSSNARTMTLGICLRTPDYSTLTWNQFAPPVPWGTAGCSNATTDYYGTTALGTASIPASPTLNTPIEVNIDPAEFKKMYDGTYTNNGFVMFVNTQNADGIVYAGCENATVAYRPYIMAIR